MKKPALHIVQSAANAVAADSAVAGMSTEPFATAHDAVYTLVRILLNKGVSAEVISQNTGISANELDDPDARVPLSQFVRLWEFACAQLRNPGLALELHDRYPENRMHFVAHLGMRCATMREAIDQWGKYAFLVAETDEVRYAVNGSEARFIYSCKDPRYEARWFAEHYMVLGLFYARTFTGEPLALRRATFKHPAPEYQELYARTFEAPVEFGAEQNALVFDVA
ncbi:MAG: AraC family transcriptional regulator, partial [Burkholderiaceae bacterium]